MGLRVESVLLFAPTFCFPWNQCAAEVGQLLSIQKTISKMCHTRHFFSIFLHTESEVTGFRGSIFDTSDAFLIALHIENGLHSRAIFDFDSRAIFDAPMYSKALGRRGARLSPLVTPTDGSRQLTAHAHGYGARLKTSQPRKYCVGVQRLLDAGLS